MTWFLYLSPYLDWETIELWAGLFLAVGALLGGAAAIAGVWFESRKWRHELEIRLVRVETVVGMSRDDDDDDDDGGDDDAES
ncbi:MAG: hypothetical protein ACPHCN_18520 [Mycobacterium sp.]